jgi:hypothetical protein
MSLLADNLTVLLHLQVCRLQDDSSVESTVDGEIGFHVDGLHKSIGKGTSCEHSVEEEKRSGLEVCCPD